MKIILFANTAWYLWNFRLPLAQTLRECGAEVLFVAPPDAYAARLQDAGFRFVPLALARRSLNPLTELRTLGEITALYRRERPALVHHFTVKPVLYGSLAARLADVPQVVNAVTGLGYLFGEGGVKRRVLRRLAMLAYRWIMRETQVIFQNQDDRDVFLRHRLVTEPQTTLIPSSGVDLEHFRPQPEPNGEPVVMLAARLLWDKGVGEFVQAAGILRRRGVGARFVLVGDTYDGNPSAVPREQLQAWQRAGMVEWWGWRDDMAQVFASAHIVCLPSYREGLPKSLIEAAACARPVVTTDAPGCRDAVVSGETGLLVPLRDAEALAAALEDLIVHPERRRKMGAAARKFARRFSVERVVAGTLAVYRRAGLEELTCP